MHYSFSPLAVLSSVVADFLSLAIGSSNLSSHEQFGRRRRFGDIVLLSLRRR